MREAASCKTLFDLLVCTCDGCEDTWTPFFTLLKKHWPGSERLRIVLTTERKDFSIPGLTIACAKTGMNWRGKSRPWGARMLASLGLVNSPLVLLMLDDYFIDLPVQTSVLEEVAAEMKAGQWDSVGLIPQGDKCGQVLAEDERLVEIDRRSPYRVNTQAALWRPAALRSLLKAHESPWEFELRGTVRAESTNLRFMRLRNGIGEQGNWQAVISYPAGGGIWRGKWRREEVVDLFARSGIEVGYFPRGFYSEVVTIQRRGIRRIVRRDLLSYVLGRVKRSWSHYRSSR